MKPNLEKVKLLSRDLRHGKEYPRSPRETFAGYVLAARAVDKCRAVLAKQQGEYHSNCPLDQRWLKFAEIDYDAFRAFVATGATDAEIATWIADFYNTKRRHSAAGGKPPVEFERIIQEARARTDQEGRAA